MNAVSETIGDLLQTVDRRGVATVTLNRPERHNAFDDTLIATLTGVLRALDADPSVRIVVLRGAGRSFSAGADLGWMRRMADYTEAENVADARALANLLHTLHFLRKPTIAVAHGNAFGGGVGLVAACDVALASDRAGFCLSEVRIGLTPATISPFVIAAIGSRQAHRYMQTAEMIPARRAQEIGLVHEVAPEPELEAVLDGVVSALLAGAPEAQADAKALIALCHACPIDSALAQETSVRIAARRASGEGREGVDAFLNKREPRWRQSPTEQAR